MAIIRFLNKVTGGNLLAWKVVAATAVFALAGLQLFFAGRFWDQTASTPSRRAVLERLHRINGRVALILAVAVAISCLLGPAGPTTPNRVLVHSLLGTALFVILVAKFAILRVVRRGYNALPIIGTLLFIVFGGIWLTTVFDFVTG
jgi:hypothetical protein